jgi:hypothetical protein
MPRLPRTRLALALVLAPLGLQALAVHLFGVNTLVWDEFFYADFLREVHEGKNWLHWLSLQHNEHRVVPMKLAMIPLAFLTRWNTVAEMYLSVVLAGLVILGLWKLYRRSGGEDLLLFAPVAWLVCSLSQYQNILFGMMMCHYFTLLGVVWALVFLARRSAAGLVAAVLCGLLASFSILNGLLIWPVGLLLLLAWGERRSLTAAWTVASLGATLLYFYRFQMPGTAPPMAYDLRGLYRIASFAITSLGSPLGAGSIDWSRAAGFAMAVALGAIAWRWLRKGRQRMREEALLGALILFALLSCAMIAVGRASYGIPPLESRYIAYSSLAMMGIYLILGLWSRGAGEAAAGGRLWLTGATVLLIPGLIAANLFGLRESRSWRNLRLQEKFLLQTSESQPDEVLAGLYFVPEVRRLVPYLRAERLGPFNEPQDLLLLMRWREGHTAHEILPERPLEQTLVCKVGTLWEVGAVIATYGRKNQSNLSFSLWEGERQLGDRMVPLADLADGTWISVPLKEPLRDCAGRHLTLRLESPDGAPGNAASVWTYPDYFEGRLRHAGTPGLEGRDLGLEINAFRFGIMK